MAANRDARRGQLRVQAAYSIAQLLDFAGLSRHVLRTLLQTGGVQFLRSGRVLFVPLAEIEQKLPKLWQSFWLLEGSRLAEKV